MTQEVGLENEEVLYNNCPLMLRDGEQLRNLSSGGQSLKKHSGGRHAGGGILPKEVMGNERGGGDFGPTGEIGSSA